MKHQTKYLLRDAPPGLYKCPLAPTNNKIIFIVQDFLNGKKYLIDMDTGYFIWGPSSGYSYDTSSSPMYDAEVFLLQKPILTTNV